MTPDSRRWVAVLTHANCEANAEFHLRRQGYEVYLPRYLKLVRHAHRRDYLPRPLFPRYLFVRLAETDTWRPIRSTVGVSGLIYSGEHPAEVPAPVVAEIRSREDQRGFVGLNSGRAFAVGDAINVNFGSFSDFEGIFESCDDLERVTVLLKLLGRHVKVYVPLDAIQARA